MNLPKTRLMAIEESTEDLIDFGTMIDTVWRGKAVILSVILACIMAAAVYVYLIATPMFRASSVVMMESREACGRLVLTM